MSINKNISAILLCLIISACGTEFPLCIKDPCVPIPGSSQAAPIQQTYAARSFFSITRAEVSDCHDIVISDTKYNGLIGVGANWSETWIIEACSTKWKGEVIFNPDGNVAIKGGRLFKRIQ